MGVDRTFLCFFAGMSADGLSRAVLVALSRNIEKINFSCTHFNNRQNIDFFSSMHADWVIVGASRWQPAITTRKDGGTSLKLKKYNSQQKLFWLHFPSGKSCLIHVHN